MKKVLFVALLSIVSLGAYAQHEPGTFTLAPKAGINLAKFTNLDNSRYRVGAVAGLELEGYASEHFGVAVGAFWSQEGGKEKIIDSRFSNIYQADYVNIPVTANFYIAKGFALKVGVQAGINVRTKIKLPEQAVQRYQDIRGTNKPAVISVPLGFSYEVNNIVFDARYNWGLSKTFKTGDIKNSTLQFTLGYKFAL